VTAGLWTDEEIAWAKACFAAGDSIGEIAEAAERDWIDVAVKVGAYGPVPTIRRTMVRGEPSRWVGCLLKETAVYRRLRGETREDLAALAGVGVDTMDKVLSGLVPRGRKRAVAA
jgi:hypothetical protein